MTGSGSPMQLDGVGWEMAEGIDEARQAGSDDGVAGAVPATGCG
jgi:hypothetical protein